MYGKSEKTPFKLCSPNIKSNFYCRKFRSIRNFQEFDVTSEKF